MGVGMAVSLGREAGVGGGWERVSGGRVGARGGAADLAGHPGVEGQLEGVEVSRPGLQQLVELRVVDQPRAVRIEDAEELVHVLLRDRDAQHRHDLGAGEDEGESGGGRWA